MIRIFWIRVFSGVIALGCLACTAARSQEALQSVTRSTGHHWSSDPAYLGSPAVPLDSWIYPALDRLVAFGYITTAYADMRPWTRIECGRMLEEAQGKVEDDALPGSDAARLFQALAAEFSPEMQSLEGGENAGLKVDSLYTRATDIAGPPLRDSYHFAQTVIDDYGRPYGQGVNEVTGLTAHGSVGPLAFSLQGEYQHAPAVASDPASTLQATAVQDLTLPLANGTPVINRLRLLESTVSLTYHNLQVSAGRQSLWLGPGDIGPFLFSNNADPVPMIRFDRVTPYRVPLLSRVLGPARMEFFLGQLSGHRWVFADGQLYGPEVRPQPFIHGSKVSFKPTPNFEFGMGFTVLFGGPRFPFTWHNFFRTFTSFNTTPGAPADPGDRRSCFDFSYRVPYLRHWLTVYLDSFVEDEISPLGSTRPSLRMGTYFSHVPRIPKLDLRLEGIYTDVPGQQPSGFLYWNGRYRSGYTNDGNLLASWIGRQGRGGQAWATYWFSPRDKLQLSYRHQENDQSYIGGGHLNDVGVSGEFRLRPDIAFSGALQYEQWRFPVLSSAAHSDFTTSMQLTFYPRWKLGH